MFNSLLEHYEMATILGLFTVHYETTHSLTRVYMQRDMI